MTADNPLRETIDGIEGKEVIVSRELPPQIEPRGTGTPARSFMLSKDRSR